MLLQTSLSLAMLEVCINPRLKQCNKLPRNAAVKPSLRNMVRHWISNNTCAAVDVVDTPANVYGMVSRNDLFEGAPKTKSAYFRRTIPGGSSCRQLAPALLLAPTGNIHCLQILYRSKPQQQTAVDRVLVQRRWLGNVAQLLRWSMLQRVLHEFGQIS